MNFNHDTGLIDTLQTLDCTSTPPGGGVAGVLTITGNGALTLTSGTTLQRPGSPVNGMIRYNTDLTKVEVYENNTWVSEGGGTVTSIAATGSTGLTVGGSPITSSGTITLTLGAELQALSGLSSTGLVVRTGSATYAEVTIAGTASNISVTNGSGVAGNPTIDLINAGTPVSNSFQKITTDAKGRVTATSSVTSSDITTSLGYTPVNKAGDSMSGTLTMTGGVTVTGLPTPTNASDAAPKSYVDALQAGLEWKDTAQAATTANLAATYVNGTAGVGATLTNSGTQVAFAVDGYTASLGDRILVKNQTTQTQNGIYTVTTVGSGATNWVLTRATDANTTASLNNATLFVTNGTANSDSGWTQTTANPTIGTNNVVFVQFSGAGTYTAGTGLTLTGNAFSLTSPVTTTLGGTGLTSIGTANQVLGVNTGASALEYKTITAGTAISVTPTAGVITIANTGVTAIAGTANQITASASTGSVTLSLPSSVTISSSLTVSGLTANSFLYSGTAGLLTTTTAPTNGQILIGSTGAAPVAAAITQGTGITVTNGAGSITIANAGVTSIVAGTGISISGATGAVTVNNTGVTSVALAAPSIFTVSGSPVTTTGTLTFSLNTQNANTVFSGPVSGGAATPTFRALVYADVVSGALKLYAENASSPTNASTTGTNAVAIGNGSLASATNAIAIGNGTNARMFGMTAIANGSFATAGDAQKGNYVSRAITTDATANVELFLDGATATQRLVLQNNALWTFDILVSARRTDTTGGGAGYRFTGVIRKDATAASTVFVGVPSKVVLGETNAAWDVAITADTTNGSLKIAVTGEAAKTIRWVAAVQTSEVTN